MTCPGGGRETGRLRPGTVPGELSHRDGDLRIGFDKPRCRVAEQQRRNLEQHGWRWRFPAHPVSPSTPVSPAGARTGDVERPPPASTGSILFIRSLSSE